MKSQAWNRVAELFAEVVTLPSRERESFIRGACGDDVALSNELASLLRAHDQTSGPLDVAPPFVVDEPDSSAAPEPEGTLVGPYRLLRPIGEGGMGSVWLAERSDGTLKRAVALKRPHATWIGSAAGRMAQERDILASLEHPNIARLYDAGITDEGRPYLALEYVEGVPINQYCVAHALSIRQRLELFLQVLEAIRYAHAHLVIHRDIKPSNILVSVDGRAHLLDFGIARLLDPSLNDAGSQFAAALTPDYASPEQIRGDSISTASDVYSLGVVLYEIVTGARPYRLPSQRAAALASALERVEIRPPSASVDDPALRRSLHGDVDSIICKTLRRQPEQRYATVDALASDISRFLRDQPVSAQPDRLVYRVNKFLLRNRWQSVSAAIAIVALIAGAALTLWQAHAARLEAARAEQVKGFALSLLDSADSDQGAGVATTAVDLLQAASKRVEIELAGRPAIAAELMTAIGYGLIGQDRAEDAAALLKKAIALSTAANGPDDARTVDAEVIYGEALYELGKNDEAMALLKSSIGRAHRIHDVHAEVDAWRWLASVQLVAGDESSALASAHAAVAALAPIGPNADQRALLDAMQARASLANVLANTNSPGVVTEARAALKYAAQMGNQLEPTAALDARVLLGIGLMRENQPAEGLRVLQSALADTRRIRGGDHTQTDIVASLLGKSSLEAGDVPTALAAYQESFDSIMRHESAHGPYNVAQGHYGLAAALAASHDHERALSHFDEAIRLFAEAGGPTAQLVLRARSARALSLARLERFDEADREFTSLSTMPFAGGDIATHKGRLAVLRSLQGRHDEAVTLAQASADGLKEYPSRLVRAQGLARLGSILLAAHRRAEAIAPLEQSIALFSQVQLPQSPEWREAIAMLNQARAPDSP
ncbi:MAG: serine/threonine-protein kinase [Gammaproteobacteria bacterium]